MKTSLPASGERPALVNTSVLPLRAETERSYKLAEGGLLRSPAAVKAVNPKPITAAA